MSLVARNKIDVTISLAADVIAAVEIRPRVRPPLARLFAGKPASALLKALPQLFTVCAAAQQTALLSAIEAARDEKIILGTTQRRMILVVAERISELLRGLLVGLPAPNVSAAAIRSLIRGLSMLVGSARPVRGSARREAIAQIVAALAALGMPDEDGAPRPGSPFALCIAALEEVDLKSISMVHSFLSVADDRNITERLLGDDPTFCHCPDLGGHAPETGPWARQMTRDRLWLGRSGAVARLKARIAEIGQLCDWLKAGAHIESAEPGIIERYKLGPGRGAAAVECARGRLYHAVELDPQGQISRFECLAPTEWNFHWRGPLVRNLQGAVLTARRHQKAVRAVIESLDPCVGFTLKFRNVDDA
ncbi:MULTISPECIES: nickel-dependent hydrogenase large subunit [Bradyrhizobium]|uniref:Hydrogenase expression/formation protein HupK n=1 Tax=Bradyrhizobium elkanii TaxID=29448 RepID=A0A4U6RSJ1_BRAEL|nr:MULTISPECIES: nickel-dependent hydrogenase large subunit [Bradyrhizobium]MTV19090.1 hypothetical protein [Bradyrhizobium sp. BR2003]TKV77849.1 hypothetical protein FDV58_28630 [Bradyrhizobium elkanii]